MGVRAALAGGALALLAAAAAPTSGAAPGASAAAPAALPQHGVLVPGVSLAGIRLGMPAAQVRALLGGGFGRCVSCAWETWYFNLRPFSPQGLAVELQHGRVSAVFTLWSPPGWRTRAGVATGARKERVQAAHPGLEQTSCGGSSGYDVLVRRDPGATTGFLVVGGRLWGFILAAPRAPLCR